MTLQVIRAADAVAAASGLLTEHLRTLLATREYVRLALAGGSVLAALPATFAALGDDTARIRLTWVDERCVPLADPDSNRGSTQRVLAGRQAGEDLPLWLDGETVQAALERVRAGLAQRFDDALDVTLLGMGGDGHIASLFVGRSLDGDRVVHVPDSPKPPARRMTLTRPLLASASRHVLLATGDSKRDALRRLIAGDASLPAVGLSGLSLVTNLTSDQPS